MKTMKRLALFLLLALPIVMQAQDYTCTTNNGALTINHYTGAGGVVVIPDTINALPVTRIEGLAFFRNPSLTSISIGNNVASIGNFAFHECFNLAEISIGTNLAFIEKNAFGFCGITNVAIPNSVTNIGDYVFAHCHNLTNVKIGNHVTRIGTEAFTLCSNLKNVIIGNSVKSIGAKAFYACTNLTSIIIPTGVTNIEHGAFSSCSLIGIYFEGNTPIADSSIFSYDTNLTVYYLPDTTGWGATFGGRPTALWKQ